MVVTVAGDLHRFDNAIVIRRQAASLVVLAVAADETRQASRGRPLLRKHGASLPDKIKQAHLDVSTQSTDSHALNRPRID
jgi:hypothetical protein